MAGFGGIFGSAPTLNTGQANTYLSTLGNISSNLGQQANAANTQYNGFNTNDVSALNNYSNYLSQNPATQQYNAQQTANAEQGANEGAAHATANLDQSLAQRGISPNSSEGVGGLASIQEGLAANNANIQAQEGEQNQQQHAQNLNTLANLWNGASNTAFDRGNTLQQQQGALNQNMFSDADQLAMQQYQQQEQQQQSADSFLSGIGGLAANYFAPGSTAGLSLFGGGSGGGSGPMTPYNPATNSNGGLGVLAYSS